jgi:hypothetical protein
MMASKVQEELAAASFHIGGTGPVVWLHQAKDIVGGLETALEQASGNILCGYCGTVDRKPEPWSSDAAMEIILEHLTRCPDHPLNQLAIVQEQLATRESQYQVLLAELVELKKQ